MTATSAAPISSSLTIKLADPDGAGPLAAPAVDCCGPRSAKPEGASIVNSRLRAGPRLSALAPDGRAARRKWEFDCAEANLISQKTVGGRATTT
jgi:hypothetical protein